MDPPPDDQSKKKFGFRPLRPKEGEVALPPQIASGIVRYLTLRARHAATFPGPGPSKSDTEMKDEQALEDEVDGASVTEAPGDEDEIQAEARETYGEAGINKKTQFTIQAQATEAARDQTQKEDDEVAKQKPHSPAEALRKELEAQLKVIRSKTATRRP